MILFDAKQYFSYIFYLLSIFHSILYYFTKCGFKGSQLSTFRGQFDGALNTIKKAWWIVLKQI